MAVILGDPNEQVDYIGHVVNISFVWTGSAFPRIDLRLHVLLCSVVLQSRTVKSPVCPTLSGQCRKCIRNRLHWTMAYEGILLSTDGRWQCPDIIHGVYPDLDLPISELLPF